MSPALVLKIKPGSQRNQHRDPASKKKGPQEKKREALSEENDIYEDHEKGNTKNPSQPFFAGSENSKLMSQMV